MAIGDKVTIHYLHPADDGPIGTGSEGVIDPHGMIAKLRGDQPIKTQRLRFACNPKGVQANGHQGSNELSLNALREFVINCPDCLKSERFLKDLEEFMQKNMPGANLMVDAEGKCC